MSRSQLCLLLVVPVLVLSGCAGPAAPVTAVATAAPSAVPPAAAATPTVSGTQDLIPASQINDAAQARLRLAYFVFGGPNVDLLINGRLAVNGGRAQSGIPADFVDGYIYLAPGSYHVAVVATGQNPAQAISTPLDLPLVAGHRYTVAVIGQTTDKSFKSVVIDETAAELKAGAVATDSVRVWVNSLVGGPSIVIHGGGVPTDTVVAYGDYATVVYPAGNFPISVKLNRDAPAYPGYPDFEENWNTPGASEIIGLTGVWGQNSDVVLSVPVSPLNIVDFLDGFTGKDITMQEAISFKTLVAAIKTAGLAAQLSSGGPYFMLAPTDAAFKAMPGKQREALLADPRALANLLHNHLVAEYVPKGTLGPVIGGGANRSFTNLLGTGLAIVDGPDGILVNGASIGYFDSVFVANGGQIHPISTVLVPTAQ